MDVKLSVYFIDAASAVNTTFFDQMTEFWWFHHLRTLHDTCALAYGQNSSQMATHVRVTTSNSVATIGDLTTSHNSIFTTKSEYLKSTFSTSDLLHSTVSMLSQATEPPMIDEPDYLVPGLIIGGCVLALLLLVGGLIACLVRRKKLTNDDSTATNMSPTRGGSECKKLCSGWIKCFNVFICRWCFAIQPNSIVW